MPSLKIYVRLWIFVAIFLTYEFWALSHAPQSSFLIEAQKRGLLPKGVTLSNQTGKWLSIWYGWIGFTIMAMTNLYTLRKRLGFLSHAGKVSRWLDFHIFCGLVGPTFILFHTGFKIGGLVAISFWSMAISFASGLVGRYFYMQLVASKAEVERAVENCVKNLKAIIEVNRIQFSEQNMNSMMNESLAMAGVPSVGERTGMIRAVASSVAGDFMLNQNLKKIAPKLPKNGRKWVRQIVVYRRRAAYMEQFRKIMGYWHSFHQPFAVFMYVVAAIHIATALLMQVSE